MSSSTAVPFFAGVYPGRLDNFIDWSAFHYGGYARHELLLLGDVAAALRRSQSHAPSFFDVGANIGNHALFMALQGCAVFAFEQSGKPGVGRQSHDDLNMMFSRLRQQGQRR